MSSPVKNRPSSRQSQSKCLIPDGIEPVIAWRVWVVGAADGRLYSIFPHSTDTFWNGVKRFPWDDEVPLGWWRRPCSRWGLHACKSKAMAQAWGETQCGGPWAARTNSFGYPDGVFATEDGPYDYRIGQVVLWGRIIEHEYGYRAEYAMLRDEWEGVESFT